ncbi:MAG: hypothetical protein EA397_00315 [Deltaproteobacteria bacterium]|nr:MAG: hypothetical protein EA397_00315 [Deltaproteobacteria bacterium]
MTDSPRFHPSEIAEARRVLGPGAPFESYLLRQRRARERVALKRAFYLRYPCRMATLHRLASTAIAIARFAALSECYDEIGEGLMPVTREGRPKGPHWESYTRAFEQALPADVREERWLIAQFHDMEQVKAEGWVERFYEEQEAHPNDPTWALLRHHMDVSLGTRLQDGEALAGQVALETAITSSLRELVGRRLWQTLRLVAGYSAASARAMILGGPRVQPHLPSDRGLVWQLVVSTAQAARITRVVRAGIRHSNRGIERLDQAWSLLPSLERALGSQVHDLHPSIAQLFSAMHTFRMVVSVHLTNRLTGWLAWGATLLVGQGMYEQHLDSVPARFRLFKRPDDSLNFVREFWCDEAVRVFDSDFVVREVDGHPTLLEVFRELGVAAQMRTEVLEDGGLSMTIVRLFVRGFPVGIGSFFVRFETRPAGERDIVVTGVLELRPKGTLGRGFWHSLLRLPQHLGAIRYEASPVGREGSGGAEEPDAITPPEGSS